MFSSADWFDAGRQLYAACSYYRPSGRIWPPLRVIIEPTYRCNCRCPFCYVEDHSGAGELTTEQWLGIIAQVPRYAFISFEGGEVTLRRDFFELLRFCRQRVWGKVNVLTNGTALSPERTEMLAAEPPLVVSVSLDGTEAVHDSLRGPGSFAKSWDTLERIAHLRRRHWARWPWIDVKLVLLPQNVSVLPELFEKCGRLGAEYFSISLRNDHHLKQNAHLRAELGSEFTEKAYPLAPYFDMCAFERSMRALHELRQRYKTAVRWAPKFGYKKRAALGGKRWEGSQTQSEFEQIARFLQGGALPLGQLYKPCLFPYANLFINPQGDVYPCLSVCWGNAVRQPLAEIYNGAAACQFRRCLRRAGVFPACQLCCEAVPR
ncbi:radical SAM protein [bacterium]|nr:radical SAM protein [bacterium]